MNLKSFKLRTVWKEYFLIFILTLLILLVKFPNIFSGSNLLPGWDSLGHYYAFLKSIKFLENGELRAYALNWFGGMPLFYFYPPLAFWLMSSFSLIFTKLSTVLIFKGFILLSLALTPVSFHFFIRSFFPKRKINLVLSFGFALAYLFY